MRKTLFRALSMYVLLAACLAVAKTKDEWKQTLSDQVKDNGSNLLELVTNYTKQFPSEAPVIAQAAAELLRERDWKDIGLGSLTSAVLRAVPERLRASVAKGVAVNVVTSVPKGDQQQAANGVVNVVNTLAPVAVPGLVDVLNRLGIDVLPLGAAPTGPIVVTTPSDLGESQLANDNAQSRVSDDNG